MTTTTEPQRAPVIETPENPDVIEVTISEVDRQTAQRYTDLNNCIICTALRNRGINVNWVGVEGASIEGSRFLFDKPQTAFDMHVKCLTVTAPFYERCVVGKTIRLNRVT